MYAEGSVPGLFNRMEINHLSLPLHQILSTVPWVHIWHRWMPTAKAHSFFFLAQVPTTERGIFKTQARMPRQQRQTQTKRLLSAHLWRSLMSNHIQMALEEVSEQPTNSMQMVTHWGLPSRTCPKAALSPPGLNPPWACRHVTAHHPADRQVPDWGRPLDWETSLIATVHPPLPATTTTTIVI